MKICIGQIEVVTGDLVGNARRMCEVIAQNDAECNLIVFPELSATGYNCGSLFETKQFIHDSYRTVYDLAESVHHSTVIVGAPRWDDTPQERGGALRLYNSLYILRDGICIGSYDKQLLANDYQHEDRKYFLPGNHMAMAECAGDIFGLLLCEDIWSIDHDRDLIAEMKAQQPNLKVVVCANFSYFTYEKLARRMLLLSEAARRNGVWVVYNNVVGIGDIVKNIMCYDGNSLVYNPVGELTDQLAAFAPETRIVELTENRPTIKPEVPSKNAQIWKAMLYSQKTFFSLCGLNKGLVALSGGLDSSIVAVQVAKAMGPEGTAFVTMPGNSTGEQSYHLAEAVARRLKIPLVDMSVVGIEGAGKISLACAYNRLVGSDEARRRSTLPMVGSTLAAVGRTVLAQAMCHAEGRCGVVNTGNHTENALSWVQFHDVGSSGVWQPIGDLTKTELFALAEYVNELYGEELIPEDLFNGKIAPAAELPDSDEDPFDYYLMSGICAEIIRHRATPNTLHNAFCNKELSRDYFPGERLYEYSLEVFMLSVVDAWERISRRSVWKNAQGSPPLIMSPRSRGFSSREPIINYYRVNSIT